MVAGRHVAVFGAGLAGFTAAVTALEEGAQVTLFEKSGVVGGSTALSGGIVWTHADVDEMCAVIPQGNPVLQRVVFDGVAEGRRWLRAIGVRFTTEAATEELGHSGWASNPDVPDEGLRGLGQQMEPPQALDVLRGHLGGLGGTLRLETALDGLVVDDRGAVVGARVVTADGQLHDVRADSVVLATGGFQGNPELLQRYVVPAADNLYLRSNPWSTGDALMAAQQVGAGLTAGLNTFYGHAMAAPPARFRPIEFGDVTQGYGQGAVAINLAGRRFTDESEGTGEEVLNQRLARESDGRGYYVFDDRVARRPRSPGKAVNEVIVSRAKAHGAPVVVAESLTGLVDGLESLGVPSGAARRSLDAYNDICSHGGRSDGIHPGRARFRFPILEPPFFAVGVKASITSTFGGLAVDADMRVLRRSGSSSPVAQSITELAEYRETPIAGLFAAGNDVGNISHGTYLGGLATALTTGRVAGRSAARR